MQKGELAVYTKPLQWKQFYHDNYVEYTDIGEEGNEIPEKQRLPMIQKIICNMVTQSVFAQDIEIINKQSNTEDKINLWENQKLKLDTMNLNLKEMFLQTIAYGEIGIDIIDGIPTAIYDYTKEYDNGELVKVCYKIKTNNEVDEYIHLKEGDTFFVQKNKEDPQPYSGDRMRFFIVSTDIVYKGYGQPIYANVLDSIRELNNSYMEMCIDRELSRKMVLLPRQMETNKEKLKKLGISTPRSSKDIRLFRQWDPGDENHAQPIYLDGKFDPQSYIDEINTHLHFIGWGSGIGNNILTFDNTTGGIKTLGEVKINNAQFVVLIENMKLLFKDMIVNIGLRYAKDFEVIYKEHGDETMTERHSRLLSEYQAGLISKEGYHTEIGRTEEEIEKVLPNEVAVEDIYKKEDASVGFSFKKENDE